MKYYLQIETYTNHRGATFTSLKTHSSEPEGDFIEFEGDIEAMLKDKTLIKNGKIDLELIKKYIEGND